MIKDNLARAEHGLRRPEVAQGGPWGYRHQFNIADSGYGNRGPRVWNDRAGEVGRTLNVKDFDLDRIFGQEGVQILHLSGLIAALSPETEPVLPRTRARREEARHEDRLRPELPRHVLERPRERAQRHLRRNRRRLGHPRGQRGGLPACLGVQGPEAGGKDIKTRDRRLQGNDQPREEGLSARDKFTPPPCVKWKTPTITNGAPSWRRATSGMWSSRAPSACSTASAVATVLWAA